MAFVRFFESLLNLNRKKMSSYESKRFKVLDDKYYNVVLLSDTILLVVIAIISLLSPRIDSLGLYSAMCSLMIVLTMKLCKSIGLRKMYIEKLT